MPDLTPLTTTPPFSQQFPAQYQAWLAAGGAENNFRAFLYATGVVKMQPPDVLWMQTATAGHLNELSLALKQIGVTPGVNNQIVIVSTPTS
jgi:hypothetical protein